MDTAPAARLFFLDGLRIAAFALLVPYHVGMYYVSWGWHVKSPHAGPALEPLMRLLNPWRLDLLFLVSGAATAFMLAARPALGSFLRRRASRLLLPLLAGMLVIVPPQSYWEVVEKHAYAGGYLDFMRLYLTGYGGFCTAPGRCLVLPTWNHLWFLPYLFVYTALLAAVLVPRADALIRTGAWLERRFSGMVLLVLPIAWLALTRALLKPRFPETHALVDDLFAHTQYGAMFLLGAALARAPAAWPRFEALRWPALGLAVAAWLTREAGFGAAFSIQQWCALVAAIGFAHRHLDRDHPWRRELTLAVFPVYILHQTVIVALTRLLAPANLPPLAEGLLIVAATFAFCIAAYALIRRSRALRPWFGLDRDARAGGIGAGPSVESTR